MVLEGSAIRLQGGEEISARKEDFWRTPGNVPHTMRAGPEGARVLDIFSPPRPEYRNQVLASQICRLNLRAGQLLERWGRPEKNSRSCEIAPGATRPYPSAIGRL